MGGGIELAFSPSEALVNGWPKGSDNDATTALRPPEEVLPRLDPVRPDFPKLAANAPWIRGGGAVEIPELEAVGPRTKAQRFDAQERLLTLDIERAEYREKITAIQADLNALAAELKASSPGRKVILLARSFLAKRDAEVALATLKSTLEQLEQKREVYKNELKKTREALAASWDFNDLTA